MKKKILIVEDDQLLSNIEEKVLEVMNYDSIVVTNGKEAIDTAAAQLPDLIILDIMLDDMSGLEVASGIRQNEKTHSIPILATTGVASWEECRKSGCDDYITKPFTPKDLLSKIEKLLQNSR